MSDAAGTGKTERERTTFRDRSGRAWEVEFTVGLVQRLKRDGLDLKGLLADPERFAAVMAQAPEDLVGHLWTVCEPQAKAFGLTPEEFGYLFDRETYDAAADAFLEAFVLFSQRSAAGAAIRERFPRLMERMDRAISERLAADLDRILSGTATASPGSAASTPPG